MGATLSTPISVYAVKSGSLHKRACAENCAANAADHCFVDIAGAVKKQKKRLHPEKERMQPFLWYNVIVKKQTPQEYYTAYQLKLPVEISDPVYSYSEVMDHIDLNKYLTIEERRPGRPRYDQKTLLKIILFAFMENGYASVREIEKYCKTDIRYMWLILKKF